MIQSVGELCLSPIGLSMTTKLAPAKLGGLAMGCWFLSIAIGNNLAGIFAGQVSGEAGDRAVRARGLHLRLLCAGRFGRAVVPDRAADQQADAPG